tara:strand:- start:1483 stop:3039 length:1557 start_codon:yes stop_codon:yes gene_type:complete
VPEDICQTLRPLYGDIHNHCGISYGHGPLTDALANARQRLDFVSITGHAHWPDMPDPEPRIQPVIDFHLEGFAKLKAGWPKMLKELRETNREGEFTVFPAFEVHSCASGDRNILYKDLDRPDEDLAILYPDDLDDLNRKMRALRERGIDTLAQPHHIGYKRGFRGIDWETYDSEFAPVVELISMHGCSEESDNTRPFLHVMGPSDYDGTFHSGLARGYVFGVTGGTDHHSGHPGSYGHGLTGIWAEEHSRDAIWNAFYERRSWAMSGDRIELRFSINGTPMGGILPTGSTRSLSLEVNAGAAIDYVDVLKNNRLIKRVSECDLQTPASPADVIRTKLYLELGWGPRNATCSWDATLGIEDGRILNIEPRFRGRQVVSPLEGDGEEIGYHTARVLARDERQVSFETISEGTPNNFTTTSQGMCIEVEMPRTAKVFAELNGQRVEWPLEKLIEGARSGMMNGIESNAWRMNRAPLPHELNYRVEFEDDSDVDEQASYYARVRQRNGHWAWSSPSFVRQRD